MEMEFDVKITGGILYDFLMFHNYSKVGNLIVNIVGAIMLIGGGVNVHIPFLIGGAVILLYLPLSLLLKAKQFTLNMPKRIMHTKKNSLLNSTYSVLIEQKIVYSKQLLRFLTNYLPITLIRKKSECCS